jgi:GNAT superfamily N-acetyltransferase
MVTMDGDSLDSRGIRRAGADEAGLLTSVVRAAYREVAERFQFDASSYPMHPSWCSEAAIREDVAKGMAFFVSEADGVARGCYGFLVTGTDSCRVEKLAVVPEQRNRGTGTLLLEHAFDFARRQGLSQVEVSILHNNTDLRSWYEKRGFVLNGTVRYPNVAFVTGFLFAEVR